MPDMPKDGFLDVDRIVSTLGVSPGQHVADLGCGSGYFTAALSRTVGKDGVVTAVDVMQEALQSAQARAEALGFQNVQTVRADLEVVGGTKLPDASQDLALAKNILFQSQKKQAIIAEAARITKPGGHVVIIDWEKGSGGFGPPDNLRTDADAVREMGQSVGLRQDRLLALDHSHFGIIFVK